MDDKKVFFIAITVFITVFISSMLLIISGSKAAILGTVIVPSIAFAYRYPRLGLLAFLIYLPFSGTVTYSMAGIFEKVGDKITYTSDYPLFHLAKDAFYFPALIAIVFTTQSFQKLRLRTKPLLLILGILLAVCLLTILFVNFPQQLAAKNGSPLLMGIIGLKTLVGYIPLILCGYYLIRDQKDLFLLTRLLLILILICCGLSFIQYFLLANGICQGSSNLPDQAAIKTSLQARCFVGGSLLYNPARNLIRLPGTFVSPWQWGWFLISSAFIAYAASFSDPSRPWRIVSWIAMIFILVASVISGQKSPLLLVPIIFLILLLLTEKRKKWLAIKLGIIVFVSILIATQLAIVQEALGSLISRWNYSPPYQFMAEQWQWITQDRVELLGHGLGRATSAARRLGETKLIETFYVKLLYENGILGVIAFLAVVSTLTVLTFKAYRSLQNPSPRHWGICLWVFVLLISYNPYYYPLAVDPVAVYYWFFAGILLKLPELEDRQKYE